MRSQDALDGVISAKRDVEWLLDVTEGSLQAAQQRIQELEGITAGLESELGARLLGCEVLV